MRIAMLLETEPSAALGHARALLATHPGHDAATLLFSNACRRLGNSSDAINLMQGLARTQPASVLVQLELGRTFAACARPKDAVAALERTLELDATLAVAWYELSAQRLLAGETAAADAAYGTYRQLAGNPPDLADAYAAFDQNHLDAAESLLRRRLHAGGDEVAGFTLLAAIESRRGDDLGQEAALKRVLALAPCDGGAREQLAQLLIRQGRTEEALALIVRLLAADPLNRAALLLKADALQFAERQAESTAIVAQLIAVHPKDADLWVIAGNQQRFSGHSHAALDCYRHAIDLKPGNGLAYWGLSNLAAFDPTAALIESMQQLLNNGAAQGYDATCLHFALGKALEDRAEFAASFEHYASGNLRARSAFRYDPTAITAFVQRFKATFSRSFFAQRSGWGCALNDPIFIVGLPRSGSTLLEQILASHSHIEGTRELPYVPTIARQLAGPPQQATRYPENLGSVGKAEFETLAARYLDGARVHRLAGKSRFIDKMHVNFTSLGLLQLMFPRAIIIDSRRHPMGCGFACYKQLFGAGLNFAYDLTEVGRYYRDYVDLMDHVDAVLPGRVYRVHYEHLVADPENVVRRLLAHCGLPFESACLRFHENQRVAQTLSSEQVRRPIYAEGVNQWRHYEPWLAPLSAVLGPLIEAYPSEPQ
jgi:tetratricopeptide (TPR) repeat protein